jgi:hypothetical protein
LKEDILIEEKKKNKKEKKQYKLQNLNEDIINNIIKTP